MFFFFFVIALVLVLYLPNNPTNKSKTQIETCLAQLGVSLRVSRPPSMATTTGDGDEAEAQAEEAYASEDVTGVGMMKSQQMFLFLNHDNQLNESVIDSSFECYCNGRHDTSTWWW
jgi:hypothetical protein